MRFRQNLPALSVVESNGKKESVVYTISMDDPKTAAAELTNLLLQITESDTIKAVPGNRVFLPNEQILVDVHDPAFCEGRGCAVHHPSDHHMKHLSQKYNYSKGYMQRICEHDTPHPDPDEKSLYAALLPDVVMDFAHGCDGCCHAPTSKTIKVSSGEE